MPQPCEGEERSDSKENVTTNNFQLDTQLFKELPVVTEPEGLLSSAENTAIELYPESPKWKL
jgi:hypothetical protein